MKLVPTIILAMTLGSSVMALELGDPAPRADVKMKNATADGAAELSIAEAKGDKGTLVIFSCNHCPFVVAWEERITALGNAALGRGIGVIQVNSNDPQKAGDTFEAMQKRARARGFKFPYVVDATSDVARAFGATRTPEAFLFNAAGQLVYHGTIDDNHRSAKDVRTSYLQDAVDAVVAGTAVPVAATKAVGCGIKFR